MIVIIAMHWVFSYIANHSQWFSGLTRGHATSLIRDGEIERKALRNAHMSFDDLDEELRQQGVAKLKIAEAHLERSGKLSVIKRAS